MKRKTQWMAIGFGAIASQASMGLAHADDQPKAAEYEIILLDKTGSMADLATSDPNANPKLTYWDNAVNQAQAWLGKQGGDGKVRGYAIWTFVDTADCCGGTQDGVVQIWPVLTSNGANTSTECGTANKAHFEAFSLTTFDHSTPFNVGFCVSDVSTSTALTDAVSGLLGEVGDTTSLREKNRPAPNSGGTPLAESLCATLDALRIKLPNASKVLTLETDAGENASKGYCAATNGNTKLTTETSFPKTVTDWNLSADTSDPSWQAKVMRRAVRLNSSPPSSDEPTNNTIGATAVSTPIKASVEDIPSGTTGFTVNVDVHFRICRPFDDPATTGCTATALSTRIPGINLPGLGVMAAVQKEPNGHAIIPSPNLVIPKAALAPLTVNTSTMKTASGASLSTASTGPVALAATTTTTSAGVPLIDQNEFLFLQGLGHVNSKSAFHAVVADSSVVFGTTHRLPGDVDDSGCTDIADFNIIKQKDVYHQRAVLPLQIAIRADLNRDGWVTKADAQIVLNNWGKGCINPPGVKPKL